MTNKLSLLAVFAHPDDESCGPGATLAMYAHQGVEVSLLCVTRGERGAWGADQAIPPEEFGDIRVRELSNACSALGISRWTVLGYPDGEVSRQDTGVLLQDILLQVWTVRPQVMITTWPEGTEGHSDHDAVALAATDAFLRAGDTRFCEYIPDCLPYEPSKLYYTVPPDQELVASLGIHGPLTQPDISSLVEAKIKAMRCHVSQKECSEALVDAVRRSPRWVESFRLAHSRVPPGKCPEDDLFAGIEGDESRHRRHLLGGLEREDR